MEYDIELIMTTDNPHRITTAPYPGRDLAIISLLLTFLMIPILGSYMGLVAAKTSIKETNEVFLESTELQLFAKKMAQLFLCLQIAAAIVIGISVAVVIGN